MLARELKLSEPKVIDASYSDFKAETPPNAEIDRRGAENVLSAVAPLGASLELTPWVPSHTASSIAARTADTILPDDYAW